MIPFLVPALLRADDLYPAVMGSYHLRTVRDVRRRWRRLQAVLAPVSAWTALSLKVEEGDVQAIKTWLGYRYGLPKQIVEQTNLNVDAGKLTDDEIKKIETNLEKSY